MKKLFATITALFSVMALAVTLSAPFAYAAPSGLYFAPSSGDYGLGTNFSTQLRLSSGKNGVKANIAFDPSKLSVTSVSTADSAYKNLTFTYDNTAGTISLQSTGGTGIGDELVATISLHAIGSGTANLTFTGTNQTMSILLLVQIWSNVSTNNASYTIAAPASPPSSTATPSAGSTAAPSTSGSTAPSDTAASPDATTTIAPSTSSLAPSPSSSTPDDSSTYLDTSGLITLPSINSGTSEVVKAVVPIKLSFTYLPVLVACVLALGSIAIFASYRRNRMLRSVYRLAATNVLTNLHMRDGQGVLSVIMLQSTIRNVPTAVRHIHETIAPIIPNVLSEASSRLLVATTKNHDTPADKRWTSHR